MIFQNFTIHIKAQRLDYPTRFCNCLLYTSDAADERSSVDLGGRRIIKKKKKINNKSTAQTIKNKTSTQNT